jgi:murein DD-endopeptidase MepM/ murein hydrolase activator NlpD
MEVENVDMKKLFPEKKFSKKGIMEFLDKKGFYIVLILCIAVVGTVAVFVTTSKTNTPDIDMQKLISDNSDKNAKTGETPKPQNQSSMTSKPATTQDKANSKDSTNKAGTSKPSTTQDKNPSGKAPAKSTVSSPLKFTVPVSGSITFEYAEDKLVYSSTLEEWTTHSGVDLAAERGTPVKAAADGVISEIKNDPGFGTIVIISHSNGVKTVYANLASECMVVPNQKVQQGDVIGSVGNTANFEISEQPHLHFEVRKNDKIVSPMTYLPAIK